MREHGNHTETVYCPYCLEPFDRVASRYHWSPAGRQTCGSAVCRSRMTAWQSWVKWGRINAVAGDVNRPAKGGPRLPSMPKAEVIEPYRVHQQKLPLAA
jgi:hypothetical protein